MNIENRIHQYRSNGTWYQRKTSQITKIVVHHSAIPLSRYSRDGDMMRAIQNIHQGKGWPGLSYHFVIGPTGKVYQTNNFTDITWHDSVNNNSIGVLVHGYFHPDVNDQPTKEQLVSLAELLTELSTKHPEFPAGYNDIYGHRDIKSTACPGNNLYPYVTEFREKRGQVDWAVSSGQEAMPENKYTEAQMTEVRLERDKNWNLYQEEKKRVTELQETLKQTRSEYDDFRTKINQKLDLPASSLPSDTMGAIERLLSVEDQLSEAQKKLLNQEKKFELEKSEMRSEMDKLRAEIEKQQKQNEMLLKRVDDLEQRLENREQAIEASTRFTQFINNILKLFERK